VTEKPLVEVSPSIRAWNVFLSSMAVVLITLDATIANIALPRIQSDLNLTTSQVPWILTSYILANAIFMPLTGFLADRFGKRELLLASVVGFVGTSFLCGASQNLEQLVAARMLQGASGAFLLPVSQSILLDIHTKESYARAVGLWSMGIILGPIIGPTMGGYLTETLSWHWVFLINIPLGVPLFIGLTLVLPNCPNNKKRKFDLKGFVYLGIAVGLLQLLIDRGEGENWLQSWEIRIELVLSLVFFAIFFIHITGKKQPFIQLSCFKDGNYVAGMFFTSVTNWVVFGTSALLPGYLQRVMGYSVADTGLLMIPRGVGMLIAMAVLSRLPVSRNPLLFIAFGFILVAYSLSMMGNYNVQLNSDYIVWTGILQGIGTSFVFLPTNVLCYLTLPAHLQTDAASSLGLIRNLSGSIGISTIFTVFARDNQMFHALLAETITPTRMIVGWPDLLSLQSTQGAWILNQELTRQATMQSYLNIFIVMEWMALAIGLAVALALFQRMLTR